MAVDVISEIVIGRPPQEAADSAADPDNAPRWYASLAAPMMASSMRRASRKDLARLKESVEAAPVA